MAHPDGELATSRACAKRGVHMGVSTYSNYSVEEVRAAGLGVGSLQHMMQLYTMQDRSAQLRIIRRAEEAGCAAILLTADSPVLGVRYNESRNKFVIPKGLALPMLGRTSEDIHSQTHHQEGFSLFNSDSHSWAREIPWLRSVTKLQIWIKGLLTAEDVQLAVQYGCDGVVVSNHGGRQLDQTPATIDVIQECVKAANGKIDVHIDGGIRRGSDIFKALALGAKCVWIGRPVLWGLAVSGIRLDQRGVIVANKGSSVSMMEKQESPRLLTFFAMSSDSACNYAAATASLTLLPPHLESSQVLDRLRNCRSRFLNLLEANENVNML